MKNAASFMKAVILVVFCAAAINSQSRNNLEPATVESAEIQRSSTKPKSNGKTAEVIVQAFGGAAIIYCDQQMRRLQRYSLNDSETGVPSIRRSECPSI